jgi:hypothetical protein
MIVLDIVDFVCFHINFKISFSFCKTEEADVLVKIVLNLHMNLGNTAVWMSCYLYGCWAGLGINARQLAAFTEIQVYFVSAEV